MVKTKGHEALHLPSVDNLLRAPESEKLLRRYGRKLATEGFRLVLSGMRERIQTGEIESDTAPTVEAIVAETGHILEQIAAPKLRPVFNLTGTVLHTNLGRAPLPGSALVAITSVARGASNLEFDLDKGKRGDRDEHIEDLICRLTGAEAATVVNNNAAAVLLVLNTLAAGKEAVVSRGELVEIGGAFRMPDIITRAGCKLVEIGTTNRTHARDFTNAIGDETAVLVKVHTSNYAIHGFTKMVSEPEIADIAHAQKLPFVVDLGAGSLLDLRQYGLPHEPTVAETLEHGADIVTFSGDKLLGGPQAGLIAGKKDLIARIKSNPMKRALRVDKMTIAALAEVLRLHLDPDRLPEYLPTLNLLTRTADEIAQMASRIMPGLQAALSGYATLAIEECASQIGSGSLPVESLPSSAIVIRPSGKTGHGRFLNRLAGAFRSLPIPVVGRIEDDALWLDLRCLVDENGFTVQLPQLTSMLEAQK